MLISPPVFGRLQKQEEWTDEHKIIKATILLFQFSWNTFRRKEGNKELSKVKDKIPSSRLMNMLLQHPPPRNLGRYGRGLLTWEICSTLCFLLIVYPIQDCLLVPPIHRLSVLQCTILQCPIVLLWQHM